MEKLLMLGTGQASVEMIKYAKSQGIYTIVTDYLDPDKSLAKKESDEYWMINTCELDLLEQKCREVGITAVICGVSEFNLEMTMELCKRLGLPSYCTPEAWHYSKDKADFKQLCKKLKAPIPTDYVVTDALSDEELSKIVFPVMVKPVDMSGNRGISYCYNKEDLIAAYKYARSVSKSSKIVVERMLHGEEWYASYAIADGDIRLIALNAMYAQPGEQKFLYTITTTVSNHVEQFVNEIEPKIEEVLNAVGCKEGYAWVQVMLDEDGHFYIIEMGYRLDGCAVYLPYKKVCNFDTLKMLVDYSRGITDQKANLPKSQIKAFIECGCTIEMWAKMDGKVKEIIGIDKISKLPGVYIESLTQIGNTIIKNRPLGCIAFSAKNCDEMCELIDKVNQIVSIVDESGEDVIIRYTDFDYLKKVYKEGLEGK